MNKWIIISIIIIILVALVGGFILHNILEKNSVDNSVNQNINNPSVNQNTNNPVSENTLVTDNSTDDSAPISNGAVPSAP